MNPAKTPPNNAAASAAEFLASPAPAAPKIADEAARQLRRQLIQIYDLPDDATEQDIADAAAKAKNTIAAEEASRAQEDADEVEIQKKMGVGLTREQAINTIKRQRDHDAELKRVREERRPRLLEIIRQYAPDLAKARRVAAGELTLFDGAEFNAAARAVHASDCHQ